MLHLRPVVRFRGGRGSLVRLVRRPLKGVAEMRRLMHDEASHQGAGPCGEGLACTVFHGDAEGLARELHDRLL